MAATAQPETIQAHYGAPEGASSDTLHATRKVSIDAQGAAPYSMDDHYLPHVAETVAPLAGVYALHGECVLDCEAQEVRGTLEATVSFIQGGKGELQVYPFDILPVGLETDRQLRERLIDLGRAMERIDAANIRALDWRVIRSDEEAQQAFHEFVSAGYEGAMLKRLDAGYRIGRSTNWLKIKPSLDADCPIVSVYEGNGRLAGMLGGVVVSFNGVECRIGTGFSDCQRREFWEIRAELPGMIAEITYQDVTDSGQLRGASFARLRVDRPSVSVPVSPVAEMVAAGKHPLAAWRAVRGLTVRALADLSGVLPGYIGDIEARRKPGSLQAAYKLARALGVTMEDLLPPEILDDAA